MKELAVIGHCFLCDTYLVLGVGRFDNQRFSGRDGRARAEHHLLAHQQRHSNDDGTVFCCVTCVEVCTGMKYSEWLQGDGESILSVGEFTKFDTTDPLVPLYVDSGTGRRPKYVLLRGKGPATLEIDGTYRRVVPASLRSVGISAVKYRASEVAGGPPDRSPAEYTYMAQTVLEAMRGAAAQGADSSSTLLNSLRQHCPVYRQWDQVAEECESYALTVDFDGMDM